MRETRVDRVGERFKTNEDLGGYEIVIVEYNNNKDVWVQFQDEYKARVHTNYKACQRGEVKNSYHPSVCGVGFVGVGIYRTRVNGKHIDAYMCWCHMLRRAYDDKYYTKHPTYIGCSVCEEWHNFQNFAKWYEDNYYEIENEVMCLDKDILCKGNKIYSPDTCVFVPQRINTLFVKRDNNRGDCPIGVYYDKPSGKYRAYCNVNGKRKHLGCFFSLLEAFKAYKQFKEETIKQIADEYKDLIPQRLYDAMCNWTVEIDD